MSRETQVVILAAGLGTGLRPLSIERPKVLAPVCNETLLKLQLEQLQAAGVQEACLVVRPFSSEINEALRSEAPPGLRLKVSIVPENVDGTVGSLRHVREASASSVLVIYGDSLLSVDFRTLLNFHHAARREGGLCTILVHRPTDLRSPEPDGRTYHGVMSVDRRGRATRFIEKPFVTEVEPGFDLANAAVFVCESVLFEQPLLQNAKDFSIDVFQRLATRDSLLYGCDIGSGFRYDVGSIARFFDANMRVLRRELASPIPGREVSPGVWIGNKTDCGLAQIIPPVCLGADVVIDKQARIGPHAVLGNGCQIGEGAVVRDSVLLTHCKVGAHAKVENSVLGSHCRIADRVNLVSGSVLGAFSIVRTDDRANVKT